MKIQIKHWLAVALSAGLAACGGGGGDQAAVTTMQASGLAYGRTMTVTAFGSKMDDPGLQMTVDGPCESIARSAGATDSQTSFTCTVTGAGQVSPRIRLSSGRELARLQVNVPNPQLTMTVSQGTRSGTMVIELDPTAAPVTVKNFMSYVSAGFYTSTIFHRVVNNILVQGGGYTTGPTAKEPTSPAIVLESNNGLKNLRGTIAMARTDEPNSAQSQFYFNVADNPAFDYDSPTYLGYAVFGRIVSGLDILDEMGKVPVVAASTEFPSLPTEEVVIKLLVQTR